MVIRWSSTPTGSSRPVVRTSTSGWPAWRVRRSVCAAGRLRMPPPPWRRQSRLDAVRRTNLLDSAPEESFDRLTDAAASLLGTEYAFVTIVDERRSYWKSCRGVDAVAVEDRQNPVEESFCQYVVGLDDGFAVRDARLDPRTRDNPSVEAMGVIAWAGEPIRSRDGPVLGSFCVLGSEPRGGHSRRLAGEHRARPAVRAVPSRVARSGAP